MDTKGLTKTAIRGGGECGFSDGEEGSEECKKEQKRKANWTYSEQPNASSSSCQDAWWLGCEINSPGFPRPLPAVPTTPTCPAHLFPPSVPLLLLHLSLRHSLCQKMGTENPFGTTNQIILDCHFPSPLCRSLSPHPARSIILLSLPLLLLPRKGHWR